MNFRLPLILLPFALVAGCNGDNPETARNRAAAGEVLDGTISDSMLPYDTVVSQPPLADPEAAAAASARTAPLERTADDNADEAEEAAEEQAADGAEPEAPAEQPAQASEPAGE